MEAAKSSKTILVVDDDETLRDLVRDGLLENQYQVKTAANGKEAVPVVESEKIDLIVSDIQMPEMTGLELSRFIKKTKNIPVVLMTGFSNLLETKEAADIGISTFLAKPFKLTDLLEIIRPLLEKMPTPQAQEISQTPATENEEYYKVKISDFVSGSEIKYDIFIPLPNGSFSKIAHSGENLPREKIVEYESKGIHYLYLKRDHFLKYMGFNLALVQKVKRSETISPQRKLSFVKHAQEVILERFSCKTLNQAYFSDATSLIDTATELLNDETSARELLQILSEDAASGYAHSVGVSLFGVMVAKQMQWSLTKNLLRISVAGLLHDIGKKDIPEEVLKKKQKDRTPEEQKLYESHAEKGAALLEKIRAIPSDVAQIVAQHHEDCLGRGFPAKLRKNSIHPMARLIAVTNHFCNWVLGSADTGPPLEPIKALDAMMKAGVEGLDPAFFAALLHVFNHAPPPDQTELCKHYESTAKPATPGRQVPTGGLRIKS